MHAKLKCNKKQWVMSGLTPTVYACRESGVDYISVLIIGLGAMPRFVSIKSRRIWQCGVPD